MDLTFLFSFSSLFQSAFNDFHYSGLVGCGCGSLGKELPTVVLNRKQHRCENLKCGV